MGMHQNCPKMQYIWHRAATIGATAIIRKSFSWSSFSFSHKVLPMKLRDSHCVFALPQCHYNLYKHSFVLRNLFVSAY